MTPSPPGSHPSADEFARDAAAAMRGHDDADIVNAIAKILKDSAALVPHIPRIAEICKDENHPIFVDTRPELSPEMKFHMAQMRRFQIRGFIQLMRIILNTQKKTAADAPLIESAARDNAVDRAMENLGIDDDLQGQMS